MTTGLRSLEDELDDLLGSDVRGTLAKASWRILLAVDRPSAARRAAGAAAALALRSEGVVEVLHIRELQPGRWGSPPFGETQVEGAAKVGLALAELHDWGVPACGRLHRTLTGRVAGHILSEAQDIAADVIVIGASDSRWLSGLWAPRVGLAVVRRADCPVLVV